MRVRTFFIMVIFQKRKVSFEDDAKFTTFTKACKISDRVRACLAFK